jgi:nitrate reductase gamma subunit
MAVVYLLKIRWILRFPASRDRQPPGTNTATSGSRGALHSLFNIALPWEMASTRQHRYFYAQFVVFHLGVAASILMSFLIPYVPEWIAGRWAVASLQIIFLAAFLVGMARLVRRIVNPYIRAISTPDDYFSLVLLNLWLGLSFLAAPNNRSESEFPLIAYFVLTAFFLVYVPFSKISHYLYYPFARWYLGRTLGHRGVYPLNSGVRT